MSIYRPCDIRGNVAADLSPALYRHWGHTLGLKLPPGAKFVVGGDVRESTPAFLEALTEGLCQAGLDVVQLGQLPTPMIYYAKQRIHAAGCAIVTASHNAASMNGLKWLLGDRPPSPEDVADLRHPQTAFGKNGRLPTESRPLDISFDYVAWMQEAFVDAMDAPLHIVLDPMHGAWASRVRRYLHAVFPQCIFSTIRDTVDPHFGGQAPDCSGVQALHELSDAVYRERAHLGIAFDGDGDRIAVVDDEGVPLSSEETAFALLECLGNRLQNEQLIYDQKYSDRIVETIRKYEAEPLVERSGHGFLRNRMQESGALFGAEVSGHYFFRDLSGNDDGFYAACLLIRHLARRKLSLSEVRRQCPAVYMTPDLRVDLPHTQHQAVFEQVRRAWADFPQATLDGIRVNLPGGWALVRSSITEPAMTFRFEGLDWHALDDLVERFCDTLPELGDQLWTSYRLAMNGDQV